MRFVLEVFRRIREAWPATKPLGVRLSVADGVAEGWQVEDSVALSAELGALGCDYIVASSGGLIPTQKIDVYPGYQVPHASRIRHEARIPTMAVGLITEPAAAEQILRAGDADFIALGRAMLANPRWPWSAAIQLGASIDYPRQYERAHPAVAGADFLLARDANVSRSVNT